MPKFSRTKAVAHTAFFHCRGRASPFLEQKRGTNVKEAATTAAFTAGSTPDDRCPRKRHVWGTRQRRWFLTWPAPLLCLTQPFCARGHIAKNRNAVRWRASDIKGRGSSPIRPKRRKLRPRPARGLGPSFLHSALYSNLMRLTWSHDARTMPQGGASASNVNIQSR
jgi:hypothetical protein